MKILARPRLLRVGSCPLKRGAEVLTPAASECDLICKQDLADAMS